MSTSCFISIGWHLYAPWKAVAVHDQNGKIVLIHMMTSSNGNIFRVTCPLWGATTGHRWIPSQRQVTRSFDCFLWCAPEQNDWANIPDAGDLTRHGTHCDVTLMTCQVFSTVKLYSLIFFNIWICIGLISWFVCAAVGRVWSQHRFVGGPS